MDADVVIVGAGLAGLACARRLVEIGRSFVILEAADAVGGRVRTDPVDGFLLDRGFQFLFTAYPEARRHFDYRDLNLMAFTQGFVIRRNGEFHQLVNPRSHPVAAAHSLLGPIGTATDKLKLMELEAKCRRVDPEQLFEEPEGLTLDLLRWHGFSDEMIDRFFRPLLGCLCLDRDLITSSRLFRFLFRMSANGDAAVPEFGIGQLPEQLASRLPAKSIKLNSQVVAVEPNRVRLSDDREFTASAIVIATDEITAAQWLKWAAANPGRSVTCAYFVAPQSPVGQPTVVLNGESCGCVNHLAVMSDVSASYAPQGHALISTSIVGDCADNDATLVESIRKQMVDWYGNTANDWRHLKTYRIQNAIPNQTALALDPPRKPARVSPGIYICGSHRTDATINGALLSGWRAAQAVAEDLAER